jgi:hypothetical protein
MIGSASGFAYLAERAAASEALIWHCFRCIFEADFGAAVDPVLSDEETEELLWWETFCHTDCDPEECPHREEVMADNLWRRDPLTALSELFWEAPPAISVAELAPLDEYWSEDDEGFGDVEWSTYPWYFDNSPASSEEDLW